MTDENNKKIGVGFGIMILKDNKVLLGHRHPDPEKASSDLHGEGTWTMPGGKLHFQESFEDGAKRESLEETGLTLNQIQVISLTSDIVPDNHYITLGFLCEDFSGEVKIMEPDEITEWQWFDINDLPTPMYPASLKIVKNYLNKKFYKN